MLKEEREWPRLDVNLGCYHKYRLEPDSLLANIVLSICPDLSALANSANGSDIVGSKAIFVAIDGNCIRADRKFDIRFYTKSLSFRVIVVFRILD
jgi:hypothetical protein